MKTLIGIVIVAYLIVAGICGLAGIQADNRWPWWRLVLFTLTAPVRLAINALKRKK